MKKKKVVKKTKKTSVKKTAIKKTKTKVMAKLASAKKTISKKVASKKAASKKIIKKVVAKKLSAKATPTKKAIKQAVKKVVAKVAAKVAAKKAEVAKIIEAEAANDTRSNARIGVLGGAFDPIHAGHLNAALTVKNELKLDNVRIIPTLNPPHRDTQLQKAESRIGMIEEAIAPYRDELICDTQEITRGGISYSVDTLKELNKTYKPENIYFIMGADAFANFPQWKNVPELIKLANFVVVSRPGTFVSLASVDLPVGLEQHVKASDQSMAILSSGRTISLIKIEDMNVSSSDIRKRLRMGGDVTQKLSPRVLAYITEKGLYKRSSPLVQDYRTFSIYCSEKALDKKAVALKVYDMAAQSSYTDYSVICSATSTRHASAIADGIVESVKEEFGLTPLSVEGQREGIWVLIDYGAVVVHIFEDSVRKQYNIESLWKKCKQIQDELSKKNRVQPDSGANVTA